MPELIKLPSERVEQLRILSKNREMPIADLIGEFITEQIAKGHIEPGIPTIAVKRAKDSIEIDFGTFKRTMPLDVARAYATTLEWFANRNGEFAQIAQNLSGAQVVGIKRQGTSVKVEGENGGERTLAPSIARDLAEIVRNAAQ